MSELKEKLKSVGQKVSALTEWLGSHLGTLLTIFSLVAGALFLRERRARISAETTGQLIENNTKVEVQKAKVEDVKQEASTSGDAYDAAKREYDKQRKG